MQENWLIRKARGEDVTRISQLASQSNDFLMPYVLNPFVLNGYIDQFVVAERETSYGVLGNPSATEVIKEVWGAVHCIEPELLKPREDNDPTGSDKVNCFLQYVKQVPGDIILDFNQASFEGKKVAIIGQIICPAKGSFYAILESLKKQYDELWCWMSVVGPSYKSYERYGFKFEDGRTFWNVYKCGYSKFTLGKWRKSAN